MYFHFGSEEILESWAMKLYTLLPQISKTGVLNFRCSLVSDQDTPFWSGITVSRQVMVAQKHLNVLNQYPP